MLRHFSSSSRSTMMRPWAAAKFASSVANVLPTASRRSITSCGLHVDPSLPHSFDKIIIANRGEIACRVIRTAREVGVKTVAVYSDADSDSQHVHMADEAFRIGPPAAAESYLLGEKVLDIANRAGAQAVHPGYGFLSENAGFARMCAERNVVFIGPPVPAIEAMGSKSASKEIMEGSGVPCVPGYHGQDQSLETLKSEAQKIGFPLMIKAWLGGGGKGMRIVHRAEDFEEALDSCKREAMNSFSDDNVLLERYIQRPRHIEFQVFADQHGNALHLFERDCSVQRRHQKVLEEAPAPGMSEELRQQMGKSAVDAAKAVGYVGAGTVEFIFDAETDEYFFMEMNTRLQVEHPVTEMVSQKDLVQLQLHVAAGYELPFRQEDLALHGHSLEARIYAENPYNQFLPATGTLAHVSPPSGSSDKVRVETGVVSGDEVSIYYDPMISKLVVWGQDRAAALREMSRCLKEYQLAGLPNNIPFLQRAVDHPAFQKGMVETGFIEEHFDALLPPAEPPSPKLLALATHAILLQERDNAAFGVQDEVTDVDPFSPWLESSNLRLNLDCERTVTLFTTSPDDAANRSEHKVHVVHESDGSFIMSVDGGDAVRVSGYLAESSENDQGNSAVMYSLVNDEEFEANVAVDGDNVYVFSKGEQVQVVVPRVSFDASEAAHKGAVAPMAGKVNKVLVQDGATVRKGDTLLVMEAMKMEHKITAQADAVVDKILFGEGDFVEGGKILVTFVEAEESE